MVWGYHLAKASSNPIILASIPKTAIISKSWEFPYEMVVVAIDLRFGRFAHVGRRAGADDRAPIQRQLQHGHKCGRIHKYSPGLHAWPIACGSAYIPADTR